MGVDSNPSITHFVLALVTAPSLNAHVARRAFQSFAWTGVPDASAPSERLVGEPLLLDTLTRVASSVLASVAGHTAAALLLTQHRPPDGAAWTATLPQPLVRWAS
eukprot:605645-Amphidinium_carterae.1